ncbi:STAS domain-containing protein, partial [bacterium]|nr:STAS domain-containing protein [bacterium]
ITDRGAGVVKIDGGLNAANVDDFRDSCYRWLAEHEGMSLIVLDLDAVDFIDSAGLGVLIALLKRVSERGGDVRLARLQKQARIVFEITRAHKIFDIFDSVETALQTES